MSVTPENALAPDLAMKASLSRVTFGSCLCGDVGYRITGQPLRMVDCQCESCSREHSEVRAPNLFVPARQFRWVRGESQVVSYRLPGPTSFATAYCRRCGGDVPRAVRGLVVVPPGPTEQQVAAAAPRYEGMPPVV
ncbi:MAG: GFA family protein [Gammaproteobacteria bacterium]